MALCCAKVASEVLVASGVQSCSKGFGGSVLCILYFC